MASNSRPVGRRRGEQVRRAKAARRAILPLSLICLLGVVRLAAGDAVNPPAKAPASSPQTLSAQADRPADGTLDSRLGAWNKGVLVVLGSLACIFLVAFLIVVLRGDVPRLESDLGGFGGGLGGWQVSPSLAFLFGAIVFSLCVTILAWKWMSPPGTDASSKPEATSAAASPANAAHPASAQPAGAPAAPAGAPAPTR